MPGVRLLVDLMLAIAAITIYNLYWRRLDRCTRFIRRNRLN